jgi:hypothetical protein
MVPLGSRPMRWDPSTTGQSRTTTREPPASVTMAKSAAQRRVLGPLQDFLHDEAAGGIALVAGAALNELQRLTNLLAPSKQLLFPRSGTGMHALRHYYALAAHPVRRIRQDRPGSPRSCLCRGDPRHLQPPVARLGRPHPRGDRLRAAAIDDRGWPVGQVPLNRVRRNLLQTETPLLTCLRSSEGVKRMSWPVGREPSRGSRRATGSTGKWG